MLTTIDWLVVLGYFVMLAGVVWWSSFRQKTTTDYFLAGRNIGWFVIGGSIFSSNIGSEHIVGLAGSGATKGMGMAHWEMHAWIALMLGWVFVPFYYRSGAFTMPEFLEKRFDARSRWVLSIVSLAAYVLTKVSVTVYAGAVVFQTLLPDTFGSPENAFWVGAFATVVLTGIYTVFGGMRAVMFTDTAQTFVLLAGAVAVLYYGLQMLGGWGELVDFSRNQGMQFALWRPLSDPDFPWLGIMIASPVVGIWYWCTDQYIVQRTLSAKDLASARRGAVWAAFLKLFPIFIFLVPGLIAGALHHKHLINLPLNAKGEINDGGVFATLVTSTLPAGLRGLVVAGLLAALMSSLSALFNSSAALFTIDVYDKLRPGTSQAHQVWVGRLATTVVVGLGLLWIPIMPLISGGGLYKYLQEVQQYLAPPITAVFLLGIFHSRVNAAGAFAGLGVGFLMGLAKITIQAIFGAKKVASPAFLAAIGDFNFLYFSGLLFLFSVALVLAVSYSTAPPDAARIRGLTYGSIDRAAVRASWNRWDVMATGAVAAAIVAMYLYFSFWLQ